MCDFSDKVNHKYNYFTKLFANNISYLVPLIIYASSLFLSSVCDVSLEDAMGSFAVLVDGVSALEEVSTGFNL